MARKTIIAGNWKMNKTSVEAKALVEELKVLVSDICPCDAEIVVCPTFTSLATAVEAAKHSNIKVGAQNVHWADNGAFTGEISAAMLKELGVEYVILGHSERRQYFGETDSSVNMRLKAALKAGLTVFLCIGEVLEERESGKTVQVLDVQLEGAFKDISAAELAKIVIAYEPVWAIGTGKTATPEMAQETHAGIRRKLSLMFGAEAAENIRIQYGGSMKADNAAELLACPDIDGGLIGGAALTAAGFAGLIRNAIK